MLRNTAVPCKMPVPTAHPVASLTRYQAIDNFYHDDL